MKRAWGRDKDLRRRSLVSMKVWLLNPPVLRDRPSAIGAVVENMFYNSPPLGLGYLAAVLERAGHRVAITDAAVERMNVRAVGDMARQQCPDLVGITSTTSYFDRAVASAKEIRQALPEVPIVLGGPHINASPTDLLEHPEFSFGVKGEGEETLLEVVDRLDHGKEVDDVPGVVIVRDGQVRFAPPRPLIPDLNVLPMPARHLLPITKYVPLPNDEYRIPKTAMITSRGCPFQCIFCAKGTFGSTYRGFNAQRVVEEIHHLEDRYGINDIAIVDSTFMPNKKRIRGILDEMEKNPPRATWTCSVRANALDEEILKRMKAVGCWRIRIGIESGDAGILERIKKGVTKEEIEYAVTTADRLGFQMKAFFMVGHIGETPETIEESIRFACSIPLKDITVQINSPLKGTAQYEEAKREGTLSEEDTSRFSFFEPVYTPRGFTAEQLLAAQKSFYRRFYLRPSLVWRHFKQIQDLKDVLKYVRAVPLLFNVMSTGA
jgi:anaerobic magnesium-protoporphyrin IX monomethyl ester cyclase